MTVTLTGFPGVVQVYIPGMPRAAAGLRTVDRIPVASTDQRGSSTGASYGGAR